jgi:hypothetical protein
MQHVAQLGAAGFPAGEVPDRRFRAAFGSGVAVLLADLTILIAMTTVEAGLTESHGCFSW